MPHVKFDPNTLEPRLVSHSIDHYIRILTTRRGRDSINKQPPAVRPPPKTYPAAVFPPTDKRKKHKATYCLRLVRAMDRYDENPAVYDPSQACPLPPILRLPSELSQKILDHVLDDQDVLFPRPTSTTQALALTCKAWAADLPEVQKLWDRREEKVREESGMKKADLTAYMADLLAPLQHASAAITQTRVTGKQAARRAKRYNEKRRRALRH
ncbi:hypothetical protein CKM354_000943200 [Cercospora kikuchii]|uniref:F-box domain-containing protein n=1 Tax=Cercospora kikuchii TaxID=84275 RepID=A0A9P3CXJ3_9PEZI|nr:uncharacterized protein CKM354_000943200 [Cercospora kikuchii]GIZ46303.1 hypothetical protein CKM354_000943200 [Cercospora kikuchii]